MKSNRLYKIVSCHSHYTQSHRVGWLGELISVEKGVAKLKCIDDGIIHAAVSDIMKIDETDIKHNSGNSDSNRVLHKKTSDKEILQTGHDSC